MPKLRRQSSLPLAVLLSLSLFRVTVGVEPTHPIVPGFERFYAGEDADASHGGNLLVGELNCTACHQAPSSLQISQKKAPILNEVASRVKASHLRKFLGDPQATNPGTTMPSLFSELSKQDRDAQVEALVHFLVFVSGGEPRQEFPNVGASSRGEELFHTVGCVACHGSQKEGAEPLATSVPLGHLMSKYTLPSLSDFLRNPLHSRPSGRMPSLNLSGQDARYIASYLLKGLPEVAHLSYSYYEGNWDTTPDFSSLKPKTTGGADKIDVSYRERNDQFGLRFEGFLSVEQEGEYTFHVGSDDGSRITVDGKIVADNNGVHPFTQKNGKVKLTKGFHEVIVDYFEKGGEERLTAEYEGPNVKRQPIAGAMSVIKEPPTPEVLAVDIKPDLVKKGRELFATVGCASCHQLRENDKLVASTVVAKSFEQFNANTGCLSDSPSGRVPNYHLSARQRTSLKATVNKSSAPDPIVATLTRFNCYACHDRDTIGGVEEARNAFFQTNMQEMGDEGRLPPKLDGVGAKLTDKWMKHILADGADDRPYMLTAMPKFGADNVGHLAGLFAKADKLDPAPKITFDLPEKKVKAEGRKMIGDKGYSCIKCHSFGEFRATGIQSIDLKIMTERLQEDWLRHYLRNPQVFRPRTRMPSAWPDIGPSLLPKILDGDSEKQIAAVVLYLSDGQKAKIPAGLVTASNELLPIDEAIIYRNFIQGGGSRAIGVGYPEGVSLAFDANGIRPAMFWQGRFIDASKHWNGRGQGYQPPAGENVLNLPEGVSFAAFEPDDLAWPKTVPKELGYRFRGYRLTQDQRPTFLYTYNDIAIEEYYDTEVAVANVPLLRKVTLKSEGPVETLWMRAAVGGEVQSAGDGWYDIDGRYSVRLRHGDAKPVVRNSDGKNELLLPVKFKDGVAVIEQEYRW